MLICLWKKITSSLSKKVNTFYSLIIYYDSTLPTLLLNKYVLYY